MGMGGPMAMATGKERVMDTVEVCGCTRHAGGVAVLMEARCVSGCGNVAPAMECACCRAGRHSIPFAAPAGCFRRARCLQCDGQVLLQLEPWGGGRAKSSGGGGAGITYVP